MQIELSAGNIRRGHFYIPRDSSLFPADAWGGSNKAAAAVPVHLEFEGTEEKVTTDIAGDKRIPRNARGQCTRFFLQNSLVDGDRIQIIALGDRRFRIAPIREKPTEPKTTLPLGYGNTAPSRSEAVVQRINRDSVVVANIKRLYNYRCQVCGTAILLKNGPYAEGAHIRPLGSPHNGPDVMGNVLCLCPNHHVMLDGGSLSINDDFTLNGIDGKLEVHPDHGIDVAHLRYQRNNASQETPSK